MSDFGALKISFLSCNKKTQTTSKLQENYMKPVCKTAAFPWHPNLQLNGKQIFICKTLSELFILSDCFYF